LHKYEAVGAGFVEPDEVGIEMLGVRPSTATSSTTRTWCATPAQLATRIFRIINKI
jgi:hypothetical protein